MPTKREREYYAMGYRDGIKAAVTSARFGRQSPITFGMDYEVMGEEEFTDVITPSYQRLDVKRRPKKRKLSAWQKYIKNKRNHITYRDGKLNLKAMGVAYRRKKRR